MSDFNASDHQQFIDRACELARTAGGRGDGPYGSLLVIDGEIVMEETNREQTNEDLAMHPELTLARRAPPELGPKRTDKAIMYTSTEPCSMCSTGIAYAGLDAVVYSISGKRASELQGGGPSSIPSDEVFDRLGADITVTGPIDLEQGKAVHKNYSQD